MKYEVIVNFNEIGKKIAGVPSRSFIAEVDDSITGQELINALRAAVDVEIPVHSVIENFNYHRTLHGIEAGTPVLVTSNRNGCFGSEYGVVRHVFNNEVIINTFDADGCRQPMDIRFDMWGNEIGPHRKNKRLVEVATGDSLFGCLRCINRDTTIETISRLWVHLMDMRDLDTLLVLRD